VTNGDRRRRIEAICEAALTREGDERGTFLSHECGNDVSLRQEVDALLAHAVTSDRFLSTPLGAVAAGVMTTTWIGRRFGTYEITSAIGAGGMGEVYRARDNRLGRDVAVKVLPASFDADRERLARFQREARVLAALNDPHIASIYGVEDVDGATVLILELVDGEALADRISRGPMPMDEVIPIARQIANALEAAHDKGIVHRDLKPSNIALTRDGTVKVLDFGLAKASDVTTSNASHSPTLTVTGAGDGVLLGTAAYMSPEQARGQTVDKRTDIWAFGCVLYEMLTARLAFAGNTVSDHIVAILERKPDWSVLPASARGHLRDVLTRCLEKDVRRRWRDIGDVRLQLEASIRSELTGDHTSIAPDRRDIASRGHLVWAAASVAVLIAVAIAVGELLRQRDGGATPRVMRFDVVTPPTNDFQSVALSADGRQLAFVATVDDMPRLWVRSLDHTTARPLAGTEGAHYPFFSPDGTAIGFFAAGKLMRIVLAGGAPMVLADAPRPFGGTWNNDGVILFSPTGTTLMQLAASGGTPVPVRNLPANASPAARSRFPQFLPDGRHFLFLVIGPPETRGVWVGSLEGGSTRVLAEATTKAMYAPPGMLLVARQDAILAYHFDPTRVAVTGDPIPVAQGLEAAFTLGAAFAVSDTGMLAYRAGSERRQLVWVDRAGTPSGTVGPVDDNALANPELSPDNRYVAVDRTVRGKRDVWLIDIARNMLSRFTLDSNSDTDPVWSPDGRRIVFSSNRNGHGDLFEKAFASTGEEQPLLVTAGGKVPVAWSADGHFLIYAALNFKTGVDDLWALPLIGTKTPFPVVQTPFQPGAAQVSPDGRWLAYEWTESGQVAIYIRAFPGPGSQWQVSTGGGTQPRWRPDGRELFYAASDGRLMAVPIAVELDRVAIEAATSVPLFVTRLASEGNLSAVQAGTYLKPQYAVARDGRFLMNVAVEAATAPPITVVLNWEASLKR
jgi:Tol biopolymer transport system component